MLFTFNRRHDCPYKRSFEKLMRKHKLLDAANKRPSSDSEDFTEATDDSALSETYSDLRTPCEESCMAGLRSYCQRENIEMSEQRLFRFANYHRFDLRKATEAVDENRDNAFLDLEMRSGLQRQFVTKMLFPLTGLRTKQHNSQVIYGRPSRSDVEDDNMTKVLESLCYVMNDYSQTEQQCRDGVAIIINFDGFRREHFDELEMRQFIMALQGTLVPTRVTLVLLADPPRWFHKDVWRKMKRSMPHEFRRNVHTVTSDEKLGEYLMGDFRAYLPTEFSYGYRDIEEIIEDYVDRKAFQDRQRRSLKAR